MSKAFTREDDRPEDEPPKRLASLLPPGAANYLTPDGAERFQAQLDGLLSERPRRAAADEKIKELRRILDSAVVLGPPTEDLDIVRFGATVSVKSLSDGRTAHYRIVGIDETDVARGWISWVSPIAKALLSAAVGDQVKAALPAGEKELEILDVNYQ